jgi:hypothetical protein
MDVLGARSVGMEAFHFDPPNSCLSCGNDHVGSLTELLAILGDRSNP